MAGQLQSWTLENLAGGIDLRRERTPSPNVLRKGDNIRFVDGGSIINRPPRRQSATLFSRTQAQGLLGPFLVSNKLTCVNVSGVAVTVPAEVEQVLTLTGIDSTDLARTYLDHETLGDVLCLLVGRETAEGNHLRVELHVFDAAGDLPTQVGGFGSPWAGWDLVTTAEWRPKLGAAGGSLTMVGPDGNVYRSAVGNPRVWWDLDQEDQYDDGFEFRYYFSGHASEKLIIPLDSKRMYAWAAAGFSATGISGYVGLRVNITKPDGSVVVIEDGSPALVNVTNAGTTPTFTNWTSLAQIGANTGLYRVQVFPPRPGMKRGRYHTIGNQAFKVNEVTVLETWVATAGQKTFDLGANKLWFNEANRKHIDVYVNGVFLADTLWTVSGSEKQPLGEDFAEWATQISITAGAAGGDVVELKHRGHFSLWTSPMPVTFKWTTVLDPCLVLADGKTEVFKGGSIEVTGTTMPQRALELIKESDGYWKMEFTSLPGTPTGIPDYYRGHPGKVLIGILDGVIWRPFAHPTDQTWEESVWQINALMSGRDDAGMLPTGKRAGGAAVTGLMGVNNRLLITWKDRMALWAVNEDSGTDRFLGEVAYGTGEHASAVGVEVDGEAVVPAADGIMSIGLGNQLADRMRGQLLSQAVIAEQNATDLRYHFTNSGVLGMDFWTALGGLVVLAAVNDALMFLVRQEVNKGVWVRWNATLSGGVVPGSLMARDTRLYWREEVGSVSRLVWLDLEPADGLQLDDGVTSYFGLVEFHPLSLGSRHFKEFEAFDLGLVAGYGCQCDFILGSSGVVKSGPFVARDTTKGTPIPLGLAETSVAPRLSISVAENGGGFRLDSIGFAFRVVKRGP